MIKVLDASGLHQGISQTIQDLNSLSTQMMQIQKTIDSFVSLEDSFKGQAAEAIRSFYLEGHVPLLLLLEGFMKEYQDTLKQIQDALKSMESNENGFIRQSFLQNDLEPKIRQAENVTIDLTNDMNASINSVRDIVSLPSVDDSEFLYRAKESREMINNTLEKLDTFDAQSTSRLGKIENDLHLMNNYINKINSMFRSGNISVGNYSIRQLSDYEFHQDLLHAVSKKARTNAFSLDVLLSMGAKSVLSRFGPLSKYLVHHLQEKFEMRTMDYSVRAMQGIIQASGNRISQQQFATIKDQIVNSKDISDYQGEWHGNYFTLLDGRLVREFTNTSGAISYRFVDKIPKNRLKPEEKNMFQKTADAFQEIGSDIWKGLDTRADKATDSWYDFGNYLTLGSFDLGKNMSTGLQYNAENMLNSPADFLNWMTIGGVDTINAVINPEESFSKEHWLASITLASVVAGGAKVPRGKTSTPNASTKVPPVEKASKTSSVPLVTKRPRLNTLTNIREWFRVNVPEIGLVYDSMGGYHFVVRKGDGASSGGSGVGVKGRGKSEKADYFIGSLKGENVHLKGVKVEKIIYTKRLPEETAKLRRKFNSSVKKNFLKGFANDPVRVEYLRKASLGEVDIARMKDGLNPKGWQVHHNLPLDDGGTNDFTNLVLIKNDPYHKAVTNEQNSLTRGLAPKQSKTINWPIFKEDVYPPKPFKGREE